MARSKLFLLVCIVSAASVPTLLPAQNKDGGIPDYSLKDRKDVPVEYTWRIEDIYPDMDAFNADKKAVTADIASIEQLSKGWTTSAKSMLTFLDFLTQLNMKSTKLYSYASHQADMDMGNQELQKMQGEIQMMFVQLGSKLSFFNDDVLTLGQAKFNEYLKMEPGLKPYAFSIHSILYMKDHVLPGDQQRIASLTGLFGGTGRDASSILNDLELPPAEVTLSDGKKYPLNYANYMALRASKSAEDRTLVMKTFWANQKKFENTQATLLDGEIKKHYFNAQVYKYTDCLTARLYGDSIPTAVYYNLIKQVHENLAPLHRFLKLKKELLKLPEFRYEDVYASAVPSVSKTYSYDEAKKIIADAMKPMGAKYGELLNEAYTKRWIDVYPNKGKESGAYSAGLYGVHPYIKLNYNGNYNALSTFAHELGHSMHSWFSNNKQHYNNSEYATFLAEIASTFNENMLMRQMLKTENDDLFKLFILDNYLDGVRGTIYRQTLFAEFELAIHKKVESGQKLTADFMDQEYLKLTKEYYGADAGVTRVDDYIQCEWSRIPHFYMNYYVFQYSTGLIASLALSDMVLNGGDKERERYIEMLSAGGSDFPIAILKKAGVDMTQPEPYKAAFKQFDQMVTEMEQIVERLKKAGKL